jgi:hypothetical protein
LKHKEFSVIVPIPLQGSEFSFIMPIPLQGSRQVQIVHVRSSMASVRSDHQVFIYTGEPTDAGAVLIFFLDIGSWQGVTFSTSCQVVKDWRFTVEGLSPKM